MNGRKPPEAARKVAVVASILISALLLAGSNGAPAAEDQAAPHLHEKTEAPEHIHLTTPEEEERVGLDEKLGARIPLDLLFRDEEGREVSLGDLIDKPTIVAPVYYRCPNVCTFLQGGLAGALGGIKLKPGEEFRVLSVSFDETESPELAGRSKENYLRAAGGAIPPEAWRFLTGDIEQIRALTDAAGYRFQRRGADFLHPVAVFVVSAEGKIVRYLHGTNFLPMDLTLALVEASEGRIGTSIRKMVQFCFSYDPESRTYVFNLLRVSATVIFATAGSFLAFLILTGRKKNKNRGEE